MKTEESENIAQLTGKAVKESKSADIKEGAQELQFYGKERSIEDTVAINAAIDRIYGSFHCEEKEDIKGKVTDLLGTKDWNMAPGNTAEQVVFQTLRYFMETGGMIKDMIDNEAHEKTQKVMRYIDNVLYMRFKGGEEKIKKALDELNRLNRLQLEKDRKEDVEFSFKNHVLSYSVKDFGRYGYAVMADYGNKTDYVTSRLDGRQTVDRLNALSDEIRKYIGQDVKTAEKRMERKEKEWVGLGTGIYSEIQQHFAKKYIVDHLQKYFSNFFGNGVYNTELTETVESSAITDRDSAKKALRDIIMEGLESAERRQPGCLERCGIASIEDKAEKMASVLITQAEARFASIEARYNMEAADDNSEEKHYAFGKDVRVANPRLTDVQIILPVSKEYYITAKVNGKPMLRMPVTRAEVKAMAEGDLDIRAVAERKYARQIELAEKKGNGMKR